MSSTPLLDVEELSVSYGAIRALRGISLHVEEGEIVAVLGPNGAGKSTLLNTVGGGVRPNEGTVSFQGQRATGHTAETLVRRGMSLVPEGRHLFPRLTVEENLVVGGIARRNAAAMRSDVDELFSRFP